MAKKPRSGVKPSTVCPGREAFHRVNALAASPIHEWGSPACPPRASAAAPLARRFRPRLSGGSGGRARLFAAGEGQPAALHVLAQTLEGPLPCHKV